MPKKNKIDQINQDRELELKQIDKQAEQNTSNSIKKVLQFKNPFIFQHFTNLRKPIKILFQKWFNLFKAILCKMTI